MMMLPVHFLMVRGKGGGEETASSFAFAWGRRRACLSQRRGASFLLATVSGHLSAKSFLSFLNSLIISYALQEHLLRSYYRLQSTDDAIQ